jgi:NTE family protein
MRSNKIGLALSGGGYRATAYHIGTFRALKKMGLLEKIGVISTNSGGSITGACYALYHRDYEQFEKTVLEGVKKSVIKSIITSWMFYVPTLIILSSLLFGICLMFTSYAWVSLAILITALLVILFFQFKIIPIGRLIERAYSKFFFGNKTLKDLSSDFQTTINSTNLESGILFSFSKDKMGDSTYDYIPDKDGNSKRVDTFNSADFPVSRAVVASSSVPGAFTPVLIAEQFYKDPKRYGTINPRLVDGGVYDNQGIHKLTYKKSSSKCKHILVSDAGRKFPFEKKFNNSLTVLIRTSSIFMNRIKNFQMMDHLYTPGDPKKSIVAYQSLSFDLDYSLGEFMRMLKAGDIHQDVVTAHGINAQDITNQNWEGIKLQITTQVGYDRILEAGCRAVEIEIARSVKTNLSSLKQEQINALIKHAEAITELQVRLFLPQILIS